MIEYILFLFIFICIAFFFINIFDKFTKWLNDEDTVNITDEEINNESFSKKTENIDNHPSLDVKKKKEEINYLECNGCKNIFPKLNDDQYCEECQEILNKVSTPAFKDENFQNQDLVKCPNCLDLFHSLGPNGLCYLCAQSSKAEISNHKSNENIGLSKCLGCKESKENISEDGYCYECQMVIKSINKPAFGKETESNSNKKQSLQVKNVIPNSNPRLPTPLSKKSNTSLNCSECKEHIYDNDLKYYETTKLCNECYKLKGYSERWCIDCDDLIPPERVNVSPNVTRCIQCQRVLEEYLSHRVH